MSGSEQHKPVQSERTAGGNGKMAQPRPAVDVGAPVAVGVAFLAATLLVVVLIGAQAWGRWGEARARDAADAATPANRELAPPTSRDPSMAAAIERIVGWNGRARWPTSQPESPAAGPAVAVAGLNKARVQAGASVFQRFGCATCHTLDGKPGVGPSLMNVSGSHVSLATGAVVVADADYLRESIRQPAAKVHKGFTPVMPDFGAQINDREIDGLLEFLKSVSPDPASRIETVPLQPPPPKP